VAKSAKWQKPLAIHSPAHSPQPNDSDEMVGFGGIANGEMARC